MLLNLARRSGAKPEDAEDAVTQAMIRACEHPEVTDDQLQAWLVTVTTRLVVDGIRRQTSEAGRWRRAAGRAEVAQPGQSPEAEVSDRDEATWVAAKARELLPPRQAEALRLSAEGHDVAQVAAELGVHYRAAESLLARARRTLRAALATAIGAALWIWHAPATLAGKPMAVTLACTAAAVAVVVTPIVVITPESARPIQPTRHFSPPSPSGQSAVPSAPNPRPDRIGDSGTSATPSPPAPSAAPHPSSRPAPPLLPGAPPLLAPPPLPALPSLPGRVPVPELPALPHPPVAPNPIPSLPPPELVPTTLPTPVLPVPGPRQQDTPAEHQVRSRPLSGGSVDGCSDGFTHVVCAF